MRGINEERPNAEDYKIRDHENLVNEIEDEIENICDDDHIEDENQSDNHEEHEESDSDFSEEDAPNGGGRYNIDIDQHRPLYRGADITVGQSMCSIFIFP